MMKQAAASALKSLEGLDAAKIKAVSIIFTDTKGKEAPEEMEDEEMEDDGEEVEEEKVCKHCGKPC